ncbi:LacI family DNA-binding transcriptional regulator [Paractinoplanes maris]|uniref:LacI family DNA-binding transcriptional regulator n=1 Tax=Paractinoplanes maris TaxID=1734446 RepID=UPI002022127C|nr:LacI family DNA-binding transcriptional regulator [Actinoplanes maris]
MKHPHRIREIAAQAGLSLATVDRVLHQRGGVRQSTVQDVHQAIAALDRQHDEPPLPARTFTIDLIVGDRARVGAALRAELPGLRPAVIRPRLRSAVDPLAELTKVARAGSHGLILEAAESPGLLDAIGHLEIPVVTFGTDLPAAKRVAHVGLDETEAGATAAYLVDQWLADRAGDVLVVNAAAAQGRLQGFRSELHSRSPNRRLLITEPIERRPESTEQPADPVRLRGVLAANPAIRAVYTSATGHTAAVLAAFAAERRNYDVFVAHDLDEENAGLLRAGRLSAVLHHDLRADLRSACRAILQARGALSGSVRPAGSAVQILTSLNLPRIWRREGSEKILGGLSGSGSSRSSSR